MKSVPEIPQYRGFPPVFDFFFIPLLRGSYCPFLHVDSSVSPSLTGGPSSPLREYLRPLPVPFLPPVPLPCHTPFGLVSVYLGDNLVFLSSDERVCGSIAPEKEDVSLTNVGHDSTGNTRLCLGTPGYYKWQITRSTVSNNCLCTT